MTSTRIPLGTVELTVRDRDRTRPYLLLHGGGGVATMAGFADLLADRAHARVLLPTHPGFGGTPKPDDLTGATGLARTYAALLDELDLTGVTVVGNSFGGWVAAEIALLGSPRVRAAVVVDGIGVEVEGHPQTDVRGLSPAELQQLSWHDPARAPRPAGVPGPGPDVQALLGYTGPAMTDPTLAGRLGGVEVPVHFVWGESDGIVSADYGRAFAAAVPGSTFALLPRSGHLPQLETPQELLDVLLAPR
ncbi:alpha/beta fold hydrolase [Lentzea sp. NPDC060358]|uniref:alpha/beta fold hydrolase n=1 Tax=Lentzea sp. NPDC060358 TaxID=3347103 RepID=UPI00365283D7